MFVSGAIAILTAIVMMFDEEKIKKNAQAFYMSDELAMVKGWSWALFIVASLTASTVLVHS